MGVGGNADAIAGFDTNGNYLDSFVVNSSGDLAAPFDVYQRARTDWLVSSININHVKSYGLVTGNYIADLVTISSYRGVYELPSGNLLTSTADGVFEIDRDSSIVAAKHNVSSRFIEFAHLPGIQLKKTVGTDASVCAPTAAIAVGTSTAVTYCFEVTNMGLTTLTRHALTDSYLGVMLDGFPFTLTPGASIFLTQTAVLT